MCAPWAWPVRARGIFPVSLFLQNKCLWLTRAFRVLCAHCSVQKLRRRHVRSAKFGPVLFIKYGMCVVCFWTLEVPRERLSLLVQKSLCARE